MFLHVVYMVNGQTLYETYRIEGSALDAVRDIAAAQMTAWQNNTLPMSDARVAPRYGT